MKLWEKKSFGVAGSARPSYYLASSTRYDQRLWIDPDENPRGNPRGNPYLRYANSMLGGRVPAAGQILQQVPHVDQNRSWFIQYI